MFVLIFAFLLCLVSEVACGEECVHFCRFGLIFASFFANFATIKTLFYRNLSGHIILIQDTTFVPNLMFLGLLGPEISLG